MPPLLTRQAEGLTLGRLEREQQINPDEEQYEASPSDEFDVIFYLTKGSPNAKICLAHEFFGHLWLFMRGKNWRHPGDPGGGANAMAKQRFRQRLARVGTLHKQDHVSDPFGREFEGDVF